MIMGIFLAVFQGQTRSHLCPSYVFPIFPFVTCGMHICIYSDYRPPRLEELRTRTTTNLPSYISTSSLRIPTLYSSYCASIPVASYQDRTYPFTNSIPDTSH